MSFESTALSFPEFRQRWSFLICAIVVAAGLGYSVAFGHWAYVLVLAGLPLLLCWPIPTAIGVFALMVPFDSVSAIGDSGITLTHIVAGVSGAVLLICGLLTGRMEKPPRAAWWWTGLILWALTTSVWAFDPAPALQRIPTAVSLLCFYLVAVSCRLRRDELLWVSIAVILGGFLAAGFVTVQFMQGNFSSAERSSLTVSGIEMDPNQFAAAQLLPISLGMGLFLSLKGWTTRLFSLGVVAGMSFAVLISMSRGALVALIVMALYYCVRMRAGLRVLAIVGIFCLLLLAVPSLFFQRLTLAASTGGAGRLDIWHVGTLLAAKYGIFGTGLDNFPVRYQQYSGMAPTFHGYFRGPHNIFLGLIVETGIPGAILFGGAVWSSLTAGWRKLVRSNLLPQLVAYEAGCLSLLVAGFFLDVMWRKTFWLGWLLLALAARARSETAEVKVV